MPFIKDKDFRIAYEGLNISVFTTKIFFDPIVLPLNYLLIKLKFIKPNHITFIGLIFGILSSIAFFKSNFFFGVIGYYLFFLFDRMDGALARSLNDFHPLGALYDLFADRIVISLMSFGMIYSFIKINDNEAAILVLIYVLIFLLKDVLSLKMKESFPYSSKNNLDIEPRGFFATKLKMHFKPGQLISCFLVFFAGPLLSIYIFTLIGIICVLISIIVNVLKPLLVLIKTNK